MLKHIPVDRYSHLPEACRHSESNEFSNHADKIDMLRDYLLHVLQFGTPEERIKILSGVKSKSRLVDRQLVFL